MKLTHKERMRRAIWREPIDRLPTQVNYTRSMGQELAAHWGVPLEALPGRLDNHMLRVDVTCSRRLSEDARIYYDWWGVGWSTEQEGYFLMDAPLAESRALDDFPWPDPGDPHLLDQAAETIARDGGRHFIAPNFGFCLFERAWSLCGFTTLLMDLVLDPAFVAELLDRITEVQVALARRFVELGVDGGYFGDDYGAQSGLLFSPRTWRSMFQPRLARMFAVFRDAGLPVILHSDGQIAEIIPDLVDIGLTALNPVQPEVLDHAWLKRSFGDRLAFYGGISTQSVLPSGTPAEVRAAVEGCARALAADGTGLVVAPSHSVMVDLPTENLDALLAAFAALGGNG